MRDGVDDQFNMCMNEKLMIAAKWQSDFESVFGDATHAGPILTTPAMASVEERVMHAKFNMTSGLRTPEQIVFVWPKFPKNPSKEEQEAILTEAFNIIMQRSPEAKRLLNEKNLRFFGVGISRNFRTGAGYMAIILADSNHEACHVCEALPNGSFGRIMPRKKYEQRAKKRQTFRKNRPARRPRRR